MTATGTTTEATPRTMKISMYSWTKGMPPRKYPSAVIPAPQIAQPSTDQNVNARWFMWATPATTGVRVRTTPMKRASITVTGP